MLGFLVKCFQLQWFMFGFPVVGFQSIIQTHYESQYYLQFTHKVLQFYLLGKLGVNLQ